MAAEVEPVPPFEEGIDRGLCLSLHQVSGAS